MLFDEMSESTRQGLIRTAGFIPGARSVFTGLRLIAADAELRKLTVVPVALTAVLYIAVIALVGVFADDALGWLWPRPGSSWLIPLWYLAWVAGFVAFLLIAALLFSTVAEAVGGPFYERMATRILARHGVTLEQPGLVDGTILDIVRSLLFVIPAAIFALIGLLPAVGLPFALFGAALAWLGFGSGAINPALLVTGHRFGARLSYVRQHTPTVLGMGCVVALSIAVPFLPLISIPCAIAGAADLYGQGKR